TFRKYSFVSFLRERKTISADQLAEAEDVARQWGVRLQDALVKLGYAAPWEIVQAEADCHGLPCIDLTAVSIPQSVIELIPESVARENVVLPLAARGPVYFVVVSDANDLDTIQKL